MSDVEVLGVIPARYGSTRFPGKPLAEIKGRPMIYWVIEAAEQAAEIDQVVVATDDERILEAVKSTPARGQMTSADHTSGSDRVAEVAADSDAEIIVNVQGDEPLIKGEQLDRGVRGLKQNHGLPVATFKAPCPESEYDDHDVVKVVTRSDGRALYFSRSLVPFPRGEIKHEVYKHIGIYLYRRSALLDFVSNSPSQLEKIESLEQLRLLENGQEILVIDLPEPTLGVDRPDDIPPVEERL